MLGSVGMPTGAGTAIDSWDQPDWEEASGQRWRRLPALSTVTSSSTPELVTTLKRPRTEVATGGVSVYK